jgi:hypothetical protein
MIFISIEKSEMDLRKEKNSVRPIFLKKTRNFSVSIILPKDRRPYRVRVEESNHRRAHELTKENSIILPDGRMKVSWEKRTPRLYENYIIKCGW